MMAAVIASISLRFCKNILVVFLLILDGFIVLCYGFLASLAGLHFFRKGFDGRLQLFVSVRESVDGILHLFFVSSNTEEFAESAESQGIPYSTYRLKDTTEYVTDETIQPLRPDGI